MSVVPGLASVIEFPAQIPIKVISRKFAHKDDFYKILCSLVGAHIDEFTEEMIQLRPSSKGNYHSATLMINFQHMEALHALDAVLRAHPMVRMVL